MLRRFCDKKMSEKSFNVIYIEVDEELRNFPSKNNSCLTSCVNFVSDENNEKNSLRFVITDVLVLFLKLDVAVHCLDKNFIFLKMKSPLKTEK